MCIEHCKWTIYLCINMKCNLETLIVEHIHNSITMTLGKKIQLGLQNKCGFLVSILKIIGLVGWKIMLFGLTNI